MRGALAGATVPQVYVGTGPAVDGVQQAVHSLRGFDHVYLEPGQAKQVGSAFLPVLERASPTVGYELWKSHYLRGRGGCARFLTTLQFRNTR